jgi:hypothetical protein
LRSRYAIAFCYGFGVDGEEFGEGATLEAEVVELAGGAADEALGAAVVAAAGGVTGLGASTPAVPEPRPNFSRVVASILPLLLRPLSD